MEDVDLIVDEKTRSAVFHTRKASLFKKASELSTLCGIDVCLVLYGPDNRPVTFPTNPEEAKRIINRYRASGRHKRKLDLSDTIGPRKAQVVEEEDGSRRASKKSKYHASVDDLSKDRLVALIDRLNSSIECVESMIASKEKEDKQEEQKQEEEQESKRNKEVLGHVDATPVASMYPGFCTPVETVEPLMMMDTNGCVHWGLPLLYGNDQFVPVLCYVPRSSLKQIR